MMTFLKVHPILPSDITPLNFNLPKVYFRLLTTGEHLQTMWLSHTVDDKSMHGIFNG